MPLFTMHAVRILVVSNHALWSDKYGYKPGQIHAGVSEKGGRVEVFPGGVPNTSCTEREKDTLRWGTDGSTSSRE